MCQHSFFLFARGDTNKGVKNSSENNERKL